MMLTIVTGLRRSAVAVIATAASLRGSSTIERFESRAKSRPRVAAAAASALLVSVAGSHPALAQNVTGAAVANTITDATANATTQANPAGQNRAGAVGAVTAPKMIGDTLLMLRSFDGGSAEPEANAAAMTVTGANGCQVLAEAAGVDGWCSRVAFEVANAVRDKTATLQVSVGAPVLISGASQPVTDQVTVALDSDCGSAKPGGGIAIRLPASGGSCRVGISAFSSAPGEFRLSMRAREAGGSVDQTSILTVRARRSAGVVLAWLALGGFIGALLVFLRTLFRSRAADYAAALRLAQRYDVAAELALRSRLVAPNRTALLQPAVQRYLDDAKAGRTSEAAAGEPTLGDRISALSQWAISAQRATALEATSLTPLRTSFDRALDDVLEGLTPTARLATLSSAVDAALDMQAQGGGNIPAVASEVAQSVGPVAAPDLSTIAFTGVTTLKQLEAREFAGSLIETLLTFFLFALGALLVIWIDNDAWGTTKDVLNAILVGAGAFLGAASVKGLKDSARL